MKINKKLICVMLIGLAVSIGHASLESDLKEPYNAQWPWNSTIADYCYHHKGLHRFNHTDGNCKIMHEYITARAVAGRINNYRKAIEKELVVNRMQLMKLATTSRDNFLIELKLDAQKTILLKEQERIEEKLAIIPEATMPITSDKFSNVIDSIAAKAGITADKDIAREYGFVLEILKQADEATLSRSSYFY